MWRDIQSQTRSSLRFVLRGNESAESVDQPLFESNQRLLALEIEEITGGSTLSELRFFFESNQRLLALEIEEESFTFSSQGKWRLFTTWIDI